MELLIQALNRGLIDRYTIEQIDIRGTTRLICEKTYNGEKFDGEYQWSSHSFLRSDIDFIRFTLYNDIAKLLVQFETLKNSHT